MDKMIEQFGMSDISPSPYRRRAEAYIVDQLGDGKWRKLNQKIWDLLDSRKDQVFYLSDVFDLAACADFTENDILAVIAMLSRPSISILRMELHSDLQDGRKVKISEFRKMLTSWRRNKTLSDDDWSNWASKVSVKWVLVGKEAGI